MEAANAPLLPARFCLAGHPNPPEFPACRVCRQPLAPEVAHISQPILGVVVFSTGQAVNLDRNIIVGRAPGPGTEDFYTVALPSPTQVISRQHCLIEVNGWEVRLLDQGSENGTVIRRAGQELRVSGGQAVAVQPGDIVGVGDGGGFRFETFAGVE